ncbi:MAG TPA: SAM-dependent methyltransferase [Dehalococcoidia bacterium]|nr:SAM-dependent methyltransferase [Dehalococcoidia bacterium]
MILRDDAGEAVLHDLIAARIRTIGPIPFSEFMRLALYHPQRGYYVRHDPTLDYQSSPNVHPVFGAMIARQLAAFWRALDRPERFDVFEAGAGSGRLAADVLQALRATEPQAYAATRYVVQDATYSTAGGSNPVRGEPVEPRDPGDDAASFDKLRTNGTETAADLPSEPSIEGVILSNELLDALPFDRVRVRDGRLHELRVGIDDGRFVDVEAEPRPELIEHFEALGLLPGEGCEAEVILEASTWTQRAARALRRGYLLTLDYGYEAPDLYAPWRKRGTLLTFYRHTSGDDPYARVGNQDITASVDFTAVRRAGEAAGLRTLRFDTQTEYLASLGIGEVLAQRPAANQLEAYYALRRSVLELTDPTGLGRIRVLIQGRDVPDSPR